MPEWLKKKLRKGGAENPYALMNAAGIKKGDKKSAVSRKMSRFQKRRKKRGPTAGQAAATLVALLLALFLATPAEAQISPANFTYSYDVASTSATYCKTTGQNGSAFSAPISVSIPIETSGSSTTVTAVTATSAPFANLAVGDVILVTPPGQARDVRVITAKATDDQVTVETAVDWSAGYAFSWLDVSCGTATDDGWIGVSDFDTVQMTVQYDAGDLTTLDVAFFCKEGGLGANAVRVYPGPSSDCGDGTLSGTVCQFSTVGQGLSYKIPHNVFAQCRVSLAYSTTDGATRESVTTTLSAGR